MKLLNKGYRILVTGGAGFIGSAVVRHILNTTENIIINIDKLTYASNLDSLLKVHLSGRYYFEKIDICDCEQLDRVFSEYKPHAVMHLAAETHVDRSIDSPSNFIETNIIGTFNLLEATRRYLESCNEQVKSIFKFHHISTDEVYGDLDDPCQYFHETTSYAPSSPYSASKASSDHLVRAWYRTYNLPIVVTNCSNNYGPYQYPEKLIPLIILNALEEQTLPIYGDGKQVRDWLYVEDHARALYTVLKDGKIGETYNIGGHNEVQNIAVVSKICDILDSISPRKNSLSYKELITFVKDRPGHDKRYAIDASKIKRDLGWQPTEDFESGIYKTVVWYLENLDWCKKIQASSYHRERLGVLGYGN